MILEVKQWPESQEVMDNPNWFFITSDGENNEHEILGSSAMARIIEEEDKDAHRIMEQEWKKEQQQEDWDNAH